MAQVKGLTKLVEQLRSRAAKARTDTDASVVVGFTAKYAVYVHEDMEARHPVGQAKFLEQPARQLGEQLGELVRKAVASGQTTAQGLVQAGLRLQREAQKLCPVDTGALKGSAFTKLEDQLSGGAGH